MSERCVCCGADVPEGRQVCPACEKKKPDETMTELIIAEEKAETQRKRDIIHLKMIALSIRPYSKWWRWGYLGSVRRAIKALEKDGGGCDGEGADG